MAYHSSLFAVHRKLVRHSNAMFVPSGLALLLWGAATTVGASGTSGSVAAPPFAYQRQLQSCGDLLTECAGEFSAPNGGTSCYVCNNGGSTFSLISSTFSIRALFRHAAHRHRSYGFCCFTWWELEKCAGDWIVEDGARKENTRT